MRRFIFLVITAVLVLLLGSAFLIRAQQTNRLLVIDGARLIDGTGRPPIENSVIVIVDDKIQQVFRKGEKPYPQDAKVISAQAKTIMPGLFDIDTHIGQQGLEAAAQALSNYLYFGIFNISDTGVTLIHGEGLKKLEREGKLIAPRIFEAGPTFTVVGGHPIPTNRALGRAIDPRTLTQIDGPKAAVEQVRRYRTEYKVATLKTIMESGGVLGYPRMSIETLKALADEAHTSGLKVYAHAIQLADIKDSLDGGVDHAGAQSKAGRVDCHWACILRRGALARGVISSPLGDRAVGWHRGTGTLPGGRAAASSALRFADAAARLPARSYRGKRGRRRRPNEPPPWAAHCLSESLSGT